MDRARWHNDRVQRASIRIALRPLIALTRFVAALAPLAVLAGCPKPANAPQVGTHPKLVVLVVVDQMPTWAFDQQQSLFIGGFARLLREGAYVKAGEIPWANTFTAPGHAAIATGAPSRVNGIVGNQWYRRIEERERPAEWDPGSPVLIVGGPQGNDRATEDLGASARALRVDGIADVLRRATHGRAHSVAIGLKARAACFVAGKQPDLAIWYEPAAGGMTTSKAYVAEPPAWLVQLASRHPVSRYFGATWEPRAAEMLARVTGIIDAAPGEGGEHGLGPTFPHVLTASAEPEKAIVQTPFGDELVMSTVAAAIDGMELGKDDIPDLLAISFGAHDYASHSWGADSWEAVDLTLRLDAALGQLFESLDARVGKNNWAIVLTSDHGSTPIIERARIGSARRVPTKELEGAAEKGLESVIGPGPYVAKLSSDNIYMTQNFRQAPDDLRDEALTATARAVTSLPNVALAGRTDRFAGGCNAFKDLEYAVCLATVPNDAGEIYVYPSAGSLFTDYKLGTHHDALSDDNRRVPILVMAPGVAPQSGTGSLLQIAPTVAALLGIPPPPSATEQPLFGITAH
ncbi:MAG: type phosphodiesterase/nucleotide pyrophosphatase [Myxococcales bacterium]|nr:type phosphodiesterase/nucleotide pyrophosphatase [Myxococcales bacterium]